MKHQSFFRSLAAVLIVGIMAPTAFFLLPQKASADGGGCVGGLIGAGVGAIINKFNPSVPDNSFLGNIINTSTAGATLGSCVNDLIIVPMIRALIRELIQKMTASVVNWINGTPGANGTKSPSYVLNLSLNLQNLSDSVALPIIAQMSTSFNSPFGPAISSALRLNYTQSTSLAGFYAANQCTLTRYSPNINSFLAGNWSQGGVAAWLALTTDPANNPYMLYQSASAKVSSAVNLAQTNRRQDLLQSSGFLSWCGGSASSSSNSGNPPACTKQADCPEGYGCVAGACEFGASSSVITTTDACTNSDGSPGKAVTPGSVIHDVTRAYVADAGLQQWVNANDLDSAFNAIMQALIGQVLGGNGNGGLYGASSGGSNGGGTVTSQLQNYKANSSYASQNGSQTAQTVLANYTAYTNAWNTIITAARAALAALNSLTAACSDPTTSSQAASAAATISQILSQANAAIESVQATQALALKVQSETSSGDVNSTFASDLTQLLSMPPSSSDVANAQAAVTPLHAATASPTGSLNISGGSLIDQINLINTNAMKLQSNGCVVPTGTQV